MNIHERALAEIVKDIKRNWGGIKVDISISGIPDKYIKEHNNTDVVIINVDGNSLTMYGENYTPFEIKPKQMVVHNDSCSHPSQYCYYEDTKMICSNCGRQIK